MVSGEMGRSVWKHPWNYLAVIDKYRTLLSAGRWAGATKVGVALHWNKVCGNCFYMPHVNSHALYNTTYHERFEAQKGRLFKEYDVPAIKRVFEAADVLGMSHYAPLPYPTVQPGHFAMPMDTAAYELMHWGIDLKAGFLLGVWGGDIREEGHGCSWITPARHAADSLSTTQTNPSTHDPNSNPNNDNNSTSSTMLARTFCFLRSAWAALTPPASAPPPTWKSWPAIRCTGCGCATMRLRTPGATAITRAIGASGSSEWRQVYGSGLMTGRVGEGG